MYHPKFIDTIPTDHAALHEERVHQPDPRPKWTFRFVVLAVVIALYVFAKFPFNICPA